MKHTHLVSCICVSTHRAEHVRRTIAYFKRQSYPHRELVIVSRVFDQDYQVLIDAAADENIHYYWMDGGEITLGELRNFAMDKARGAWWCIWDDDDWHHPRRIQVQMNEARKHRKSGTILPYCILFDKVTREAFMSNAVLPPATILCQRDKTIEEPFNPGLNKGEDNQFLDRLIERNVLYPLVQPLLYIYIYHGTNASSQAHFRMLSAHKLSPDTSRLIDDIVEDRCPDEEAVRILRSTKVLREVDYFKTPIQR